MEIQIIVVSDYGEEKIQRKKVLRDRGYGLLW